MKMKKDSLSFKETFFSKQRCQYLYNGKLFQYDKNMKAPKSIMFPKGTVVFGGIHQIWTSNIDTDY